MHEERILGIIPARSGSKRVPGKNKRALGGKPLFMWALEAALASDRLDKLVLSSDDADILEGAAKLDPSVPLRRPDEIAQDRSPAIDYVRHALRVVESDNDTYGIVVIVQPTSPLVLSEDIDGTIDLLLSTGADSAVSVQRIDQLIHPYKLKTMSGDRLHPFLMDEQGRMAAHEIPDVFVRNGAVYASRRHVIDGGSVIGKDCRGFEMPRERSVDINDELDFKFAGFLLDQVTNQHS